jgi:hypothetical protein
MQLSASIFIQILDSYSFLSFLTALGMYLQEMVSITQSRIP